MMILEIPVPVSCQTVLRSESRVDHCGQALLET